MSKHNPNAWQDGFDAWQAGYDDAMYDGVWQAGEIPCQCDDCYNAYAAGQESAFDEINGGKQSAQQNAHLTPESQVQSQAVVNASALEQSDGDSSPAQAQVA